MTAGPAMLACFLDIRSVCFGFNIEDQSTGQTVYNVRQRCGRQLALESPVDADVVSTVPESATPAAMGYAGGTGPRLPAFLSPYVPVCQLACLPTCLSAFVPTCLHVCSPLCLPYCTVPTCPMSFRRVVTLYVFYMFVRLSA